VHEEETMPEYLAPGVFVEEVSYRAKSIEGVGTSVAGLVGPTRTGPLRGKPEILTSFADFVRVYGDAEDLTFGSTTVFNHTAIAAKAFFDGGGTKLFVSRVVGGVNATDAQGANSSAAFASRADSNNRVTFRSRFPGQRGNYTLELLWKDSENLLRVETVADPVDGEILFLDATALTNAVRSDDTDINDVPNNSFPLSFRGLVRRQGDEYIIVDNIATITPANGTLTAADFSTGDPQGVLMAAGLVNGDGASVTFTRVSLRTPKTGNLNNGTAASLRLNSAINIDNFVAGTDYWGTLTLLQGTLAGNATQFTVTGDTTLNAGVTNPITFYLAALAAAPGAAQAVLIQRNFDIDVYSDGITGERIYSYSNISTSPTGDRSLSAVLMATPAKKSDALASPISCSLSAPSGQAVLAALYNMFDSAAINSANNPLTGARYLINLTGGNDGNLPVAADYGGEVDEVNGNTGFAAFEDIEDIAIVMAPAAAADEINHQNIVIEMQKHCRKMRYRVGIVDAREGMSISEVRDFRSQFDDSRLALYYPWVIASDPTGRRNSVTVPPAGFIAGVYANTDIQRGVHKAPANEPVIGALGFSQDINRFQQEVLNPEGINCLRSFPGRGHRVWGGRTLDGTDPDWKYVNVRRYFLYLERSIEKSTQWVVFEPNGERLWSNVRATVEDFLYNEWFNGKLLGPTPKAAYFVRCDRSTMTQNDLDNGRLVCEIGVAPLKPAEFVIFRIGQKTADA
jgi:uncharacterized protein